MQRQLLLASLLAAAIAGCGGADNTLPDDDASSGSAASTSLISAKNLPGDAEETEPLNIEACDPLQILDADRSEAAKSPTFDVNSVKLREAVGVFPVERAARDAYDELMSQPRFDCIGETITLQGDVAVSARSPRDLAVGDESQLVTFRVRQLETGQRSSIEIASVRSGSSVASLIFLNANEAAGPRVRRDVVEIAADLLAGQGSRE